MIKLYSYYRSSASYRVRIALNFKGLGYQLKPVNLLAMEQLESTYRQINPQQLVPVLEHDGRKIFQSMAIIEYLEEVYSVPTMLPGSASERADTRALANIIACDIHPLNNTRVMKYLEQPLGINEETRINWYRYWIRTGFSALEKHLESLSDGKFCCAGQVTMADILLIPQVYNARRFGVKMDRFPIINAIDNHCRSLPAFDDAAPENQPDAP